MTDPPPKYAHDVQLRRPARAEDAPAVEVLPARAGDDVPWTLEMVTRAMRAHVRRIWEKAERGEELTKEERQELRAIADPLTKLSREQRAWRKTQIEELGGLSEEDLEILGPAAAAALGLPPPPTTDEDDDDDDDDE